MCSFALLCAIGIRAAKKLLPGLAVSTLLQTHAQVIVLDAIEHAKARFVVGASVEGLAATLLDAALGPTLAGSFEKNLSERAAESARERFEKRTAASDWSRRGPD